MCWWQLQLDSSTTLECLPYLASFLPFTNCLILSIGGAEDPNHIPDAVSGGQLCRGQSLSVLYSKLDCIQSTTQILPLQERSFYDEDVILDTPIKIEELEVAVKDLRHGSSSGPYFILPERIIYAGPGLMIWLKNIFNAIIFLQQIPNCFKSAFVIPIFKGKGK